MGQVLTAVIGAVGVVIGAAMAGWFLRPKTRAEAANQWSEAASRTLEQCRLDIANMEVRLTAAQTEATQFRGDLAATRTELSATRAELAVTRTELASTRSELVTTRSELAATRSELLETRKGVRLLIGQIERLGETPAWRPMGDKPSGEAG
jgi:septal ring factor EnvC (AmiA/AmiB activator)